MRTAFFIAWIAVFLSGIIRADTMRPAYLELRQTGKDSYDVILKVPASGPNKRLALDARFPEDCKVTSTAKPMFTGNAFLERSSITRSGGLAGAKISIDGLDRTPTDALVRIQGLKGNSQTARLTPASPSMTVTAAPSTFDVAKTYTILGTQHILVGFDHLLFVLCLVIVAGISRKLLITITGFTVAHSVTLALSTLGIVNIPTPPVEAVIALSIVFLATEIARGNRAGLTYRYPVAVSMSFGLLHGFGFAAVLGEIGLPPDEIPTSLLFFNVGVELGQLLFIGALLILAQLAMLLGKAIAHTSAIHGRWQQVAAYMIGTLAAFWTIERVVGFWPA